MSFYDQLIACTADGRRAFEVIPVVRNTMSGGAVTRGMYVDFLTQAYHHVKHTFSLLALAASRTSDPSYQKALFSYMNEERGHDEWILDDIRAIGGDAEGVRSGFPGAACELMVAYSYFVIEHVSPFALLGSVHVLEGSSVAFAQGAANAIQTALGVRQKQGFSYLRSHGALDVEHVAFFKALVNEITDKQTQEVVIHSAKMFYKLYGDIFRELGTRHGVNAHAA
jgi:pyrroloquinoline quinone (PQQ) biosynthesis protein C